MYKCHLLLYEDPALKAQPRHEACVHVRLVHPKVLGKVIIYILGTGSDLCGACGIGDNDGYGTLFQFQSMNLGLTPIKVAEGTGSAGQGRGMAWNPQYAMCAITSLVELHHRHKARVCSAPLKYW